MQSIVKKTLLVFAFLTISSILLELIAQTSETDSLENLIQQHTDKDTIRVNLLNETAYKLYSINIDKTLKYAEEAGELADKLSFAKGKAESLRIIGIIYKNRGDYAKALEYYQKSLKISEELGDKRGISSCYNIIGEIYRYWGDYVKAMDYYQKSLIIRKELGNKKGISTCYNNIGIIYKNRGNYAKALEYYQNSLIIKEELGDKRGISITYNNIGIIYKIQGNYAKALEYYQKSLIIKEELGDKRGISIIYNNIGNIYKELNNYEDALEYCKKSLIIREELGNKPGISSCYNNIGTIYYFQDDYHKALKYFRKSLTINIKIGLKSGKAESYKGFSLVYLKQEKPKKAYDYSKKAYIIAAEIRKAKLLKECSEILAKSCEALGLYKEAYKYHIVFKTMSDSLYNKEIIKKMTGLEYQYKYEKEKQATELKQQKKDAVRAEEEKRQKVIRNSFIIGFILMIIIAIVVLNGFIQKRKANRTLALQNLKIKEINKELIQQKDEIETQSENLAIANEKLQKLNATKDKFFSIVAHDLRSPFSALMGYSDLLLKNHKEYDEEERESMIKSISDSSENTFRLLENLLTWSRSQSGIIEFVPEKFNIKPLINEIVLLLQQTAINKSIRLLSNIEIDTFIYADKNMISTVLRNLITNALKFTHKNGTVIVSANETKKQGFIEISVSDTGLGISKDKINNLFYIDKNISTLGTEDEAGTGLGLILCKEFVKKNNGEIFVESVVNKGSKFTFTIPYE